MSINIYEFPSVENALDAYYDDGHKIVRLKWYNGIIEDFEKLASSFVEYDGDECNSIILVNTFSKHMVASLHSVPLILSGWNTPNHQGLELGIKQLKDSFTAPEPAHMLQLSFCFGSVFENIIAFIDEKYLADVQYKHVLRGDRTFRHVVVVEGWPNIYTDKAMAA